MYVVQTGNHSGKDKVPLPVTVMVAEDHKMRDQGRNYRKSARAGLASNCSYKKRAFI